MIFLFRCAYPLAMLITINKSSNSYPLTKPLVDFNIKIAVPNIAMKPNETNGTNKPIIIKIPPTTSIKAIIIGIKLGKPKLTKKSVVSDKFINF